MLKARVITALFLVAGFLAVLFLLPAKAAGLVFALVAALGGWEWAGLMQAPQRGRIVFGLLVFGLCLLFWTSPEQGFPLLWGLSAAFWLLFAPLWMKWRWSTACATVGLVVLLPTWRFASDSNRSPMIDSAVSNSRMPASASGPMPASWGRKRATTKP
jgi:phosphatidate cytidylyltransferase